MQMFKFSPISCYIFTVFLDRLAKIICVSSIVALINMTYSVLSKINSNDIDLSELVESCSSTTENISPLLQCL